MAKPDPNPPYVLRHANIEWHDDAPLSPTYGDIFWHKDNALPEKQAVFIDPLAAHLGKLGPNANVTVAELGFGFGVNTLLCAEHWAEHQPDAFLNIVSLEKHPVKHDDLARLLSQHHFQFGQQLLEQYPPPYTGQHVIWLADNIRLLLVFDDVERGLANLDVKADFWFLDGFSPAKNAAMWQSRLYRMMFARSRSGAGVTTYSAAGDVKRGLSANGFHVQKVPGFGQKRERLQAVRPGEWVCRTKPQGKTIIIGGGLAGLFCAEALARRGMGYELIDDGANNPSQIPQLSVKPQLAAVSEVLYRFSIAASQYMHSAPGYANSGILQFPVDEEELERFDRIAEQFPADLISQAPDHSLCFHHAGWLATQTLRSALPEPGAPRHIVALNFDGTWCGELATGDVLHADHVILATGAARDLLPRDVQLRAIRGQAISIPSNSINRVKSAGHLIFPTMNDRSVVSGTYAREDNTLIESNETRELVNAAMDLSGERVAINAVETWVGIRMTPYDRVPVVGECWTLEGKQAAGAYLCTAFGSRGATHARLCAEHIVSRIHEDPAPLGKREQKLLSPARLKGRA